MCSWQVPEIVSFLCNFVERAGGPISSDYPVLKLVSGNEANNQAWPAKRVREHLRPNYHRRLLPMAPAASYHHQHSLRLRRHPPPTPSCPSRVDWPAVLPSTRHTSRSRSGHNLIFLLQFVCWPTQCPLMGTTSICSFLAGFWEGILQAFLLDFFPKLSPTGSWWKLEFFARLLELFWKFLELNLKF